MNKRLAVFLTIVFCAAILKLGFGVTIPSALMGIGIAIDVCLATVSKFKDEDLSFKNWTLPIMFTHIGFPAIGYYGFWGLSQKFPEANLWLGLIGALLVALFIYEVFCEWIGGEPIFGISAFIGGVFGFEEGDARRYVAIMAVSWDALWSGPAKAAQAEAGEWSSLEVMFSFLIAGLVVAVVAQVSLQIALKLKAKKFHDVKKMASYSKKAMWAETSVIGGFGILSLAQGLELDINLYNSIGISALIMLALFFIFAKEMQTFLLAEAKEAVKG